MEASERITSDDNVAKEDVEWERVLGHNTPCDEGRWREGGHECGLRK